MIRIHGLRKAFAGRELFAGLDLEVAAGESVALVGPSGCGKTTLLRIIEGLAFADAGDVELEGRSVTALGAAGRARLRAERMGIVFQTDNLLPHLDVTENLQLPGLFRAQPISAAAAAAALQRVGLAGRGGQRAATLSGGEAQRVALARALAARPVLLLCDEPTASLDGSGALAIADLILSVGKELGSALLLATHDAALAARCQRQVRLGT